jgi:Fe-S-cluster containining protein
LSDKPWYRDGLRFHCTQCGNCCTGEPGFVWVTQEDIARLARHYGIDEETFIRRHVRRVGTRYSLTERADGDCTLLTWDGDKAVCTAYDQRPLQCRTFPFWPENLRTRRVWDSLADKCPGINEGEHHSFVAIEAIRTRKAL